VLPLLLGKRFRRPKELLVPYDSTKMNCYRVSDVVNNAKNETPECIEKSK